jgi:hypothetical protein
MPAVRRRIGSYAHQKTYAIAAIAVMLAAGSAVAQPVASEIRARVDAMFKRWTPTTPG